VYAASVYGTHMPKERHWTCGVEGSFIIDRDLKNDQGGVSGERYFLTCSYGIFSWLSFDGKIGAGSVDWDRNTGDDLSYRTDFAGGYGFRIKGYENEKFGIKNVMGFQHISVHPEAKNQDNDKNEAIIDEWQVSLVVSKDIGSMVPYVGSRYGTLDLIKKTNEIDRERIQSKERFGVIIGMDYWLQKETRLNMELDLVDGEEFSIGISRDF